MSSEIVWLPSAARDVGRLKEFIKSENPAAAIRAANRIKEVTKILADNPGAGKPIDDLFPFRELLIPFGNGNYVLRYREEGNRIIITRIKHSMEDDFS